MVLSFSFGPEASRATCSQLEQSRLKPPTMDPRILVLNDPKRLERLSNDANISQEANFQPPERSVFGSVTSRLFDPMERRRFWFQRLRSAHLRFCRHRHSWAGLIRTNRVRFTAADHQLRRRLSQSRPERLKTTGRHVDTSERSQVTEASR